MEKILMSANQKKLLAQKFGVSSQMVSLSLSFRRDSLLSKNTMLRSQ